MATYSNSAMAAPQFVLRDRAAVEALAISARDADALLDTHRQLQRLGHATDFATRGALTGAFVFVADESGNVGACVARRVLSTTTTDVAGVWRKSVAWPRRTQDLDRRGIGSKGRRQSYMWPHVHIACSHEKLPSAIGPWAAGPPPTCMTSLHDVRRSIGLDHTHALTRTPPCSGSAMRATFHGSFFPSRALPL